jgi:hypothetical protein
MNRVPWPDSPALFLSLLRREGINVLENGFRRFHSVAGSSCGSLDIGSSSPAVPSLAFFAELKRQGNRPAMASMDC